MNFEPQTIYHIFNQGNDRQPVFFTEENYLFFLQKMRKHILPFTDILSYCLMPNHFHLLVYVNHTEIEIPSSRDMIQSQVKMQTFNQSIGILLRSYTRAINKQENRSGSLFRKNTKAHPFLLNEFITVDHKDWNRGDYANYCLYYIHQNPVKAGLVQKQEDWMYSSARDYKGLRKGTLCNQKLANELGIFY